MQVKVFYFFGQIFAMFTPVSAQNPLRVLILFISATSFRKLLCCKASAQNAVRVLENYVSIPEALFRLPSAIFVSVVKLPMTESKLRSVNCFVAIYYTHFFIEILQKAFRFLFFVSLAKRLFAFFHRFTPSQCSAKLGYIGDARKTIA